MKAEGNNKHFERELTGRESAISGLGILAIFLLMAMDENAEWGAVEFVRVAIAFVVGIITIRYQIKCSSTPLNGKQDGE